MTEGIYDLLAGALEELGANDAYLMSDVPEDAALPYLTYFASSSSVGRLSNDAGIVVRRVQIDAYARQLADAEAIADAAEALLVGQTIETTGEPLALERADGRYRFTEAVVGLTDDARAYRVVVLLEQREAAAL